VSVGYAPIFFWVIRFRSRRKGSHGGVNGVRRDLEELYARFLEELEEREIDDLDA
jgi:hypothetical protein